MNFLYRAKNQYAQTARLRLEECISWLKSLNEIMQPIKTIDVVPETPKIKGQVTRGKDEELGNQKELEEKEEISHCNAVMVVPRVVCCGKHGNRVFLEPVTWEQMEEIKKRQGKL